MVANAARRWKMDMKNLKIIKLRNISFDNIDIGILKAAMLSSKSTMLKGDHVDYHRG